MQLLVAVPDTCCLWSRDPECWNVLSLLFLSGRRVDCLSSVNLTIVFTRWMDHLRWNDTFYEFSSVFFSQWPKLATVYSSVGTANSYHSSWVLELVIGSCWTYIFFICLVAVSLSHVSYVYQTCIGIFVSYNKSCTAITKWYPRYFIVEMLCFWKVCWSWDGGICKIQVRVFC